MAAELAASLTATEAERLEQAEGLVRGYCRWHIAPSREAAKTFKADNYASTLMLPSMYVTEVASVTVDGVTLLVDGVDYAWEENGVLTSYWWPVLPIEVVFTHGYAESPPEVTGVVQGLAQRLIDNPKGATSKTIGPFSEGYGAMFDVAEKAILDLYRIPSRP